MVPPVRLIPGGLHRDARGEVRHANAFDFAGVDRFYSLHPATAGVVRGWVGHRRDWKWFFAVRGEFRLGVVQPDQWAAPSSNLPVQAYTLSADEPKVLEVPSGYFTASVSLGPGAILLIFSSGRMEDAHSDDFRVPAEHWPLSIRAEQR